MGTVELTVKRNNSKTPLQEAASRFILRKIAPWILLQIHSEKAQQVAFTPIKLVKQSY